MTKALEEQLLRGHDSGKIPNGKQTDGTGSKGTRGNKKLGKKNRPFKYLILGIIIAALAGASLFGFWMSPSTVDTSEGIKLLREDKAVRAVVNDASQTVSLTLKNKYAPKRYSGRSLVVTRGYPTKDVSFTYSRAEAKQIDDLIQHNLDNGETLKKGFNSYYPQDSWIGVMMQMLLPMVIFGAFLFWGMSRIREGGMMNFGKSKFRALDGKAPKTKFADVAGEDEAVEELREIQEFLSEPEKFHKLGARIPKGVLLCGPPGTGKTLLAKAVAGEAQVPFFSLSGSEFVETFVGVGASRVRDLFAQAKAAAPAIIFVDEIDAVGRHRGAGMGGGNDEREQTLNQLLVEMDGFDSTTNVILIAATNRPDVLDPALLRPGRFDRQINVEAPDMKGRVEILKVHAEGKPMTAEVDLQHIAKRTPGFTGADLENVLNEAALLTARSGADLIDTRALDEAIDRVIAGPQKRTRVMNEHDKLVTAYHEGGHAICAAAQRYSDPVTKVTILPRGRALGYTMVMPTEDRYSRTRNQLLDELVYAMGGRVAEELVFEDPSTGCANDLQKATNVARRLVTDFGMSSVIGPVKLGEDDSEPFLGRSGAVRARDYSEDTSALVDQEVRKLLDQANREAWEILSRNREVLDELAKRLMEKETLLEEELTEVFASLDRQEKRQVWSYGREAAISEDKIGHPIEYVDTPKVSEQSTEPTTVSPDEKPETGQSNVPTALLNPINQAPTQHFNSPNSSKPFMSEPNEQQTVTPIPNNVFGAQPTITIPSNNYASNMPAPMNQPGFNHQPGSVNPVNPVNPQGMQGPQVVQGSQIPQGLQNPQLPSFTANPGASLPQLPRLGPTPTLGQPNPAQSQPPVNPLAPNNSGNLQTPENMPSSSDK